MKAAQHALPHNTTYTLVSTYHTGGIENGVGCQNCGKLLSNVAIVANAQGEQYHVGLDCASTLATVNPFEFDSATDAFNTGKNLRAKLLSEAKKYGQDASVRAEASSDGEGVFVETFRMRGSADNRYPDLTSRRYLTLAVYESVVKPMCGALLPAAYRTIEEQAAERAERLAQRLAAEAAVAA